MYPYVVSKFTRMTRGLVAARNRLARSRRLNVCTCKLPFRPLGTAATAIVSLLSRAARRIAASKFARVPLTVVSNRGAWYSRPPSSTLTSRPETPRNASMCSMYTLGVLRVWRRWSNANRFG